MEIDLENKAGFQKSKIGWIPNDWSIKSLGDLGDTISGLTYSPKDIHEEGVLVLRSSNVQNRRIVFDDNVFVKVEENKYNQVLEGDILICVRNGSKSLIGKNALIPKEAEGMAFGAFMTIYRSPINRYIFQLLDTDLYNREIHRNLGATINSINGKDLRKFKFPIPNEKERTKIEGVLSTWDTAITETQNLIQQLKLRKKGLMQQLLTGKKRLSGFDEEWEVIRGNELFNNHSNKNHDGELEVLSATQDQGVIPRSETGIDIKYDPKSLKNYKKVEIGDFVISLRSFQGGIEYSRYEGIVSPAYTVLKESKPIAKDFYREYLKTTDFINKLNSIIYGIRDGKQISYKEFGTLKIHYPPIDEQNAIAKVIAIADEEIKSFVDKLESLENQKKGLMQQLLTGQKRVTV